VPFATFQNTESSCQRFFRLMPTICPTHVIPAVILYSFECRKRADESLLGRIGPEVEAWPSAYDGSSQFLMF